MAVITKPSTTTKRFSEPQASSSTLRARLCSQDLCSDSELEGTSPRTPQAEDLYRQFRNGFTLAPTPEPQAAVPAENTGIESAQAMLEQLRESFTQAGVQLYTTAAHEIKQAHKDIGARVADLAAASSTTLSHVEALYSNIGAPLSATLCHAPNIPSASIATHLSNLQNDLDRTVAELESLESQWHACVATEKTLWKEIEAQGDAKNGEADSLTNAEAAQTAEFKREVESISMAKVQMLESIEEEFRAELRQETMRLMQSMMTD